MTNLIDTSSPQVTPMNESSNNNIIENVNTLKSGSSIIITKLPLGQQDQNSQGQDSKILTKKPPVVIVPQLSLKEKIAKKNTAKFLFNKEGEDFVQRITEFHKHRLVNTPLNFWPTLNGKSVDLYKLYMKVISLGGWERVCEKTKWDDVWTTLSNISTEKKTEKKILSCFNGAHALKLIYVRCLSLYEKFEGHISNLNDQTYSHNLTGALNMSASFFIAHNKLSASERNSERMGAADESSLVNRRRFSYLFEDVPMNYSHNQHNVPIIDPILPSSINEQNTDNNNPNTDSTLTQNKVATRLVYNPYEKLEQSLISGLPNELDFAFNTIMLLSADEYHGFRIYLSTHLIDLMLAHIGFFGISNKSKTQTNYRHLYDNVWHIDKMDNNLLEDMNNKNEGSEEKPENIRLKRKNYVKFWHNAVCLPVDKNKHLINKLLPKMYNKYLSTLPDQDLLNLRDDKVHRNSLQKSSPEYRRIEQVMIILNNLSFEENNAQYMANKSSTLFEFLIMCLYCTQSECYIELKKHALDILSNISRKIKLPRLSETHKCFLLVSLDYLLNGKEGFRNLSNPHFDISHFASGGTTQKEGKPNNDLTSNQTNDKFDIIRGLEILTKLCSQKIDQKSLDDYENEVIISTSHVVCERNDQKKQTADFCNPEVPSTSEVEKDIEYENNNEEECAEDNNMEGEMEEEFNEYIYKLESIEEETVLTVNPMDETLGDETNNEDMIIDNIPTEIIIPPPTTKNSLLFLNKILFRLEHLLSVQDIFVLLHSLECLYSMSQYSENICNMIVSYQSACDSAPKIVPILINLLTIDMAHFGMQGIGAGGQTKDPIKLYKIVPTKNLVATENSLASHNQNMVQSKDLNNKTLVDNTKSGGVAVGVNNVSNCATPNSVNTPLLQQTLYNQHQNVTATKLNTNLQQVTTQNSPNTLNKTTSSTNNQEQTAKNVLCNWLRTCFQMDATSEISKTKLYPYYQQIAKINNWTVLTIPTFFEILNATFPNLRYNESQITGIKLVVNIKQQLQMKKDDLIKESTDTWTSQTANLKCAPTKSSPTKTQNSPSSLNATKIKYLLNPGSMPPHTGQIQPSQPPKPTLNVSNNMSSESKSVAKIFENQEIQNSCNQVIKSQTAPSKPLTIISDLPQDINIIAASLTLKVEHIKEQQPAVIENKTTEITQPLPVKASGKVSAENLNGYKEEISSEIKKEVEWNGNTSNTEKSEEKSKELKNLLMDEIGSFKIALEKKVEGGENGHTTTTLAPEILDKPLNGLSSNNIKNNSNSNSESNSGSMSTGTMSDSSSTSENENELINPSNKENNEELINKNKRKHDLVDSNSDSTNVVSTTGSVVPELSNQINSNNDGDESVSKKLCTVVSTVTIQNSVIDKESASQCAEKKNKEQILPTNTNPTSQMVTKQPIVEQSQIQLQLPLPVANKIPVPMQVVETQTQFLANQTVLQQEQPIANQTVPVLAQTVVSQKPLQNTLYNNKNMMKNSQGTGGDFLCEWNHCRSSFHTATQIYNHVCNYHLLNNSNNAPALNGQGGGQLCLWTGCDLIKRQKWSLINHLQERHCNESALRLSFTNRQRGIVSQLGTSNVNTSIINTKDAALIAIQRHQKKSMDEFWSLNEEGPLTKSIRLLSALTLRNLTRNSEKAKMSVKPYESNLADIAFDLMESSNTIANCLWHLTN